jgi:tetratricopeptide (TPR) repeat protein
VKEGITAVENEIAIEVSILGKKYQAANFANRVRNIQNPPGKLYKIIKELGVQQGIDEFKKMLESKSVNMPALDNVGYMLMLDGKYQDAVSVYEANQAAFPESADVYASLGEIYFIQGDIAKSKSNFQEVVKRDPNNMNAVEYLRHLK